MKWSRWPLSHGVGGCDFAHDPNVPAGVQPALWLPEVVASTLIVERAPAGFKPALSLDLARLGSIAADVVDGAEHELVIIDGADEIHLRMRSDAHDQPALLLPIDANIELRLDVSLRLVCRLQGRRSRLLPPALRLTAAQKTRLVRLLHAFDIHSAGGGPRDIAATVLSSHQANLPSVEWKDSHARRAANRLIHDAIALVERGYLRLLRGR